MGLLSWFQTRSAKVKKPGEVSTQAAAAVVPAQAPAAEVPVPPPLPEDGKPEAPIAEPQSTNAVRNNVTVASRLSVETEGEDPGVFEELELLTGAESFEDCSSPSKDSSASSPKTLNRLETGAVQSPRESRIAPQAKDSVPRIASELRMQGMIVLKSRVPDDWLDDVRGVCFDKLEAAERHEDMNEQGFYDLTFYSRGQQDELTTARKVRLLWEPIIHALGMSQNALVDHTVLKDNFRIWSTGVLCTGQSSLKNPWPKRPPPATMMEAAMYCALLSGMRTASLTMLTCLHVMVPLVDWEASVGMSRLRLPAGSILIVDDKKSPKGVPRRRNSAKPVLYFTYCRRSPKDQEAYGRQPEFERPLLVPKQVEKAMTRITNGQPSTGRLHDGESETEIGSADPAARKRLYDRKSIKKLCHGAVFTSKTSKSDDAKQSQGARNLVPARPLAKPAVLSTGPANVDLEHGTDIEDDFQAATARVPSAGGRSPRVLQNSRVLPNTRLTKLNGNVLKRLGNAHGAVRRLQKLDDSTRSAHDASRRPAALDLQMQMHSAS